MKFNHKTVEVKPGESWIADKQCMVLGEGYLCDWLLMEAGQGYENKLDRTIQLQIDYGDAP